MKTLLSLALLMGVPLPGATLVKNGRSSHSICVSPNASLPDRRASAELRRFLAGMSGAQLPVDENCAGPGPYIYLGDSAALRRAMPAFEAQQYGSEDALIDVGARNIVIAGGQPRGTLYGVYTFLDRLGCRWFTAGVSRIPKRATIEIAPMHQVVKPAFEYREPFVTEAYDRDWAARNRTNGNSARLDESTGGKVEYYPFVHSFYELIPPDKYFKDHPGYFSLIDGARRVERGQLCLTNPDVLKLAVARVREWIAGHPRAGIISVSQNDWEGWCECDRCRRVEQEEGGQHSGPILRFVNAVAAEIEKTNPGKLIDTLAYWYSENPPAKVRPGPNVRVRLCPIGVCVSHPYEQCPRSAYFLKNLKAWAEITNQLYIWHYNTNFSHYLAPFPDFDELAADIPLYRRNGVVGLFMEGSYAPGGGGEMAELRSYVIARLLWDPALDMNREVGEFLAAVYPGAARPMREYFDLLHREVRNPPRGAGHLWIFNLPEFSPAFLPEAKRLFTQALGMAEGAGVRRRVEQARLPIEYLELTNAREYQVAGDTYAPADLPGWQARYGAFLAKLRGFGIDSIREGRPLNQDEKAAASLVPYRLRTIQNERWRVVVAPDLGGRVIGMFDIRSGHNLLRTAKVGDGGYPNTGGQWVQVAPDYPVRPWDIAWNLVRADGNEIVVEGLCANSVKLVRRILLDGDFIRTEVEAVNNGSEPAAVVLHVRADLDPGDIDVARLQFRSAAGNPVDRLFINPGDQPNGAETVSGAQLPAGEWMLARPGRTHIANRFEPAQVERATVNWTAKGGARVSLGVWSPLKTLPPGARLRVATAYR